MYWINVDHTWRIWKLHKDDCSYCKPKESTWKGVNEMNRNGGWFSFPTLKEAKEYYMENGEGAIWQPCKSCKPEQDTA